MDYIKFVPTTNTIKVIGEQVKGYVNFNIYIQ